MPGKKRIQKSPICWNTLKLLDQIHFTAASKRLLKTESSLTMSITDIQKQLNSTRCWGRTGPSEDPKAKWGQVQDQVSGRPKLQKRNKDSDIPVGFYDTGHRLGRWEENRSPVTVRGSWNQAKQYNRLKGLQSGWLSKVHNNMIYTRQ